MTIRGSFEKKTLAGSGDGTESSPFTTNVEDLTNEQTLGRVLQELKKTNLHLSILTGTCINNTEVE